MLSTASFNILFHRIDVLKVLASVAAKEQTHQLLNKESNKSLVEDYIAKLNAKRLRKLYEIEKNFGTFVKSKPNSSIMAPANDKLSRSISTSPFDSTCYLGSNSEVFNKKSKNLARQQALLAEVKRTTEAHFLKSVEQSSQSFYTMLQHLIDLVQFKLDQIHKYQFRHKPRPRQAPVLFRNYFTYMKSPEFHK